MSRLAILLALLPVGVGAAGLPALVNGLDKRVLKDRRESETALIAAGSNAVPVLVAALEDPRAVVREEAVFLLGRMGGPVLPITRLLGDREWPVAMQAALALGRLRAKEPSSVAGLITLAAHENRSLRRAATWALSELGSPVLPSLAMAAATNTAAVLRVFREMEPTTNMVTLLRQAMQSEDWGGAP